MHHRTETPVKREVVPFCHCMYCMLRPLDGPQLSSDMNDPPSGMQSLVNDKLIVSRRLSIECEREKKQNKNTVAGWAIQVLQQETQHLDPG